MIPHKLQSVVDTVLKRPSQNPPIDAGTALQEELNTRDLRDAFTESEIIEAARAVGVPDDGIVEFLEELASWL